MKKPLLTMGLFLLINVLFAQTDTIAKWTFPLNSADSLCDNCISLNSSRYISAQYGTWGLPSYHAIPISYTTDGFYSAPDKCAQATGWNNAADSAYWMVKLKSTGYNNIKLYSKLKSGGNANPGPKDWKIQTKLAGNTSSWNDLTTVTCTAGQWIASDNLSLPAAVNNQNSSFSIRWLVTSNLDVNGNALTANGISKLDEIIVLGSVISGLEEEAFENVTRMYPNPAKDRLYIESFMNIKEVSVYNVLGIQVYKENYNTSLNYIDLTNISNGIYFVNIIAEKGQKIVKKIVVEK